MIEIPTTLILGAGASRHVGYPLGSELINEICSIASSIQETDLPERCTREDVEQFKHRLSRSGHYSIDAFLETAPEYSALGKYLIAKTLKAKENVDHLFPPNNSGWYQTLFNAMASDGREQFSESQLSIVTFNYDRSLECYLYEALRGRFNIDDAEATGLLRSIPIVHVHGVLGTFPEIPYSHDFSNEQLIEVSKGINIIHEVADQPDSFCNAAFKYAHKLLCASKRIYFLGFGFHPDNLRRFRFFNRAAVEEREIAATITGLGPVNKQRLEVRLAELGISMTRFRQAQCNDFFSHTAPLD